MRIFINYRRVDSSDIAQSIYDRLKKEWEADIIYRDVDSLPLGTDLKEIEAQIINSDMLLVVIGPTWLDCEKDGEKRLFALKDWVRNEIEIGLEIEINVIPVLVSGAKMPNDKELPETIRRLVNQNRAELSNLKFEDDMGRLIKKTREIPSSIPSRLTREKVLDIIKSARDQGKTPDLRKRNLVNIDLDNTDLSGVDFTQANLSFAHLEEQPNLEDAVLQGANLYRAKLYRAHMKNANLRRARLKKTDLFRPTLTDADLSEVDFTTTNADLEDANMENAKLFEANLHTLDLTKAILTEAKYSPKTQWANGFDPEKAGAILMKSR